MTRPNTKPMMVNEAAAKAVKAAKLPPAIMAAPARPARIGPVQPNPARMYPKPYRP